MPPKKQIQLQEVVETQEQWESLLGHKGVQVIDVYSGWCGPCKAVVGLFRRVKNEIGDDLLKYAIAKSDNIDALAPYRERSEPTFLIFAGGQLVSAVHGAQGPQLERTIKEQLEHEHKVLEGNAERIPVVDESLNIPEPVLEEDQEPEPEPEPEIVPTKKEFTVLLIKPDAVQGGKVDDIIEQLEEKGLEVLLKEERQMTKEEAAEFYKQHEGSEHFEELCEFMSSGPCMTLVVTKGETGEGVVGDIRQLIGPPDVEKAKQEAPDSLRARYGTDTKMNALHASDSHETAARELAFFFPSYKVPWVPGTEPRLQRTLALIRPDAFASHRDEILQKIHEAGFEIALQKELTLTKEQAAEFYKEHEDKEYFDSLCAHMSSGPMMALCLAREDAVQHWRQTLGPTLVEAAKQEAPESLRAQFAMDTSEFNQLHGSSSLEEAEREVELLFPVQQTVAVIKPSGLSEKENIISKIKEAGFKVSLSEETHLTKEMAEQLYAGHKDKPFYNDLTDMMSSGPSLFMVLSREDAIVGWRALMGPPDPEEAKQLAPNSYVPPRLRALYGKSVLENAVHGSSNAEHAQEEIKMFFGGVEFNPDGTVKQKAEDGEEGDTQQAEQTPS